MDLFARRCADGLQGIAPIAPETPEKWLVLGHVLYPGHWTLVEIRWRSRTLHFYDSYANKNGYAVAIQKDTRTFLTLCGQFWDKDLQVDSWSWIGEQVR